MKKTYSIIFSLIFTISSLTYGVEVSKINVWKGQRILEVIGKNNEIIQTFKISLGRNPIGPKVKEGDSKTPEGNYTIDFKNKNSDYFMALHIDYPNQNDRDRATILGVKKIGDNIMIHGLPSNMSKYVREHNVLGYYVDINMLIEILPTLDWTKGCIALTDKDIKELFHMVKVATPITIYP